MTRHAHGRCLTIPVSVAGMTLMWGAAVALLTWYTLGGPPAAVAWGLLDCGVAMTWTILYGLERNREVTARAFDLGREAQRVSPLR